MKRAVVLIGLLALLSLCFAQAPAIVSQSRETYKSDQLVAFIPSADGVEEPGALLESWGYTATRREVDFGAFRLSLYQAVDRGAAKDVLEAVDVFNGSLSERSGGVRLLPNYVFHVTGDPCFGRKDIYKDKEGNPHDVLLQWDMRNTGDCGGVVGADLNVVEAWKLIPASHDPIVVAVVDTGVDVDHAGLKGRIHKKNNKVVGKDFTDLWGAGDYHDDHGHGSHCAGSIAAAYNDDEGMTGSAGPTNVKIIAVKALGKDGSGDMFSISDAIKWAGEQKADIISMSLGATPISPEQEPILKQVFDEIFNAPALKYSIPVAAAGNNGKDIHAFPAFCDKVIAIAASDSQDRLAPFSNFGNWVDVASPGVNIVSVRAKHKGKYLDMYQDAGFKKAEFAVGNSTSDPYDQRGYFIASGTSMACPNAVGVVAMMLAVNPKLKSNTEAVRKILMETSDKKGSFQIKADGGRINAYKAVQAAKAQQ